MKFTVFTPTFNRAHTLHRVYNSLLAQSFKDFEWLIVDDGSTDGTKELVQKFIKTSSLRIRYFFQQNRGKHVAINFGLKKARGDFFLIADSDDSFSNEALAVLFEHWNLIPHSKRKDFTGVTALCADAQGKLIGDEFPTSPFDSSTPEKNYKFKIRGEKWGFHRTEILRKFPFPELSGYSFYAEGIIWSKIGRHYKTRYINHVIRTYFDDGGCRLTKISIEERSKNSVFYAHYLNEDADYFFVSPIEIMKLGIQGVRFALHQKEKLNVQMSWLNSGFARLIWFLSFPVGTILYLLDILKK